MCRRVDVVAHPGLTEVGTVPHDLRDRCDRPALRPGRSQAVRLQMLTEITPERTVGAEAEERPDVVGDIGVGLKHPIGFAAVAEGGIGRGVNASLDCVAFRTVPVVPVTPPLLPRDRGHDVERELRSGLVGVDALVRRHEPCTGPGQPLEDEERRPIAQRRADGPHRTQRRCRHTSP